MKKIIIVGILASFVVGASSEAASANSDSHIAVPNLHLGEVLDVTLLTGADFTMANPTAPAIFQLNSRLFNNDMVCRFVTNGQARFSTSRIDFIDGVISCSNSSNSVEVPLNGYIVGTKAFAGMLAKLKKGADGQPLLSLDAVEPAQLMLTKSIEPNAWKFH